MCQTSMEFGRELIRKGKGGLASVLLHFLHDHVFNQREPNDLRHALHRTNDRLPVQAT